MLIVEYLKLLPRDKMVLLITVRKLIIVYFMKYCILID